TLATDADLLSTILTYHVVPGQIDPADIAGTHTTVQGSDLEVTGSGDAWMVNDANILCVGVQTANATVYLVVAVLMPPAEYSIVLSRPQCRLYRGETATSGPAAFPGASHFSRRLLNMARKKHDEEDEITHVPGEPLPNPAWFKPVMAAFFLLGLAWVLVFYMSG